MRAWDLPGGPRPGDARSPEIPPAFDRIGAARRCWKTLSAAELVQGDVVKLSLGAVVPADVRLVDGSVLVTNRCSPVESVPIEAGPGFETYAGALIRRARQSPKSWRRARARNSGVAPNSSAPPMSKHRAEGDFSRGAQPRFVQWRRDHPVDRVRRAFAMPLRRSRRWCWLPPWLRFPWHSVDVHARGDVGARAVARRGVCRRASRRSMKRPGWMFSAPIRLDADTQ